MSALFSSLYVFIRLLLFFPLDTSCGEFSAHLLASRSSIETPQSHTHSKLRTYLYYNPRLRPLFNRFVHVKVRFRYEFWGYVYCQFLLNRMTDLMIVSDPSRPVCWTLARLRKKNRPRLLGPHLGDKSSTRRRRLANTQSRLIARPPPTEVTLNIFSSFVGLSAWKKEKRLAKRIILEMMKVWFKVIFLKNNFIPIVPYNIFLNRIPRSKFRLN